MFGTVTASPENDIKTCGTCMWIKQYQGENKAIGVCTKLHQYVYTDGEANIYCIDGYTKRNN
jgi:hypothetical protein